MRGNVPGVAWPAIASGEAATIATLLRDLDRTQWLPAEAIRAAQFHQLGLLARHLVATCPYFHGRLSGAGLTPDDLGTAAGLSALPPLTRRDVQDAGDQLFSTEVPPDHGGFNVHKSSGSTGQPVAVRRTGLNHLIWSAMTLRDHLWRRVDFRGRLSSCRVSIQTATVRRTWGVPVSWLFDSGRSQALPLRASLEQLLDAVVEFSPHVLQTYPSVLGPLADLAHERGTRLSNLRHIHTIGETLAPRIRASAATILGAPVWDTYSCEEAGYVALQCPDGDSYHVMAEGVIVEVLDDHDAPCEAGGIGRVVVTDLHNTATPVIRYELGDYAEMGAPCACGRGLPTLNRVLGRSRNLVLLPDGTRHWPIFGIHKFRDIAPIRQFQCTQHTRDAIDVRFVVDEPPSPDKQAVLREIMQDALGHPFTLRFDWQRDPLPRGPGGKFEEFLCAVS
jgi:phenylacetate-CoA ligase